MQKWSNLCFQVLNAYFGLSISDYFSVFTKNRRPIYLSFDGLFFDINKSCCCIKMILHSKRMTTKKCLGDMDEITALRFSFPNAILQRFKTIGEWWKNKRNHHKKEGRTKIGQKFSYLTNLDTTSQDGRLFEMLYTWCCWGGGNGALTGRSSSRSGVRGSSRDFSEVTLTTVVVDTGVMMTALLSCASWFTVATHQRIEQTFGEETWGIIDVKGKGDP